MMPVVILLAIGLVLLALEIIVPGGILGIIGGCVLLVGVIVAFNTLDQPHALMVLGIALLMGIGVLVLEFAVLPHSRVVKKLSMTATVSGRSQAIDESARALIGHEAVAQTKLVPSGYVLVGDRRFEAFSRDGVVDVGARLRVVGVDNFRLIVSRFSS
jgi:membrane-bound ClpP family serine protease